jgi:hypothetical protein
VRAVRVFASRGDEACCRSGWTYQVVDDKKNEPPTFLNMIMYESNGTEHNILYFRGVNSS